MIEILHRETRAVLLRLPAQTLAGITLSRARLRGADLRGAALPGANLEWANLSGADLRRADLRGALLVAFLLRADLRGADLCGADLRGHGWGLLTNPSLLAGADLTGARYDDATRWPPGFDPVRRGCVRAVEPVPTEPPTGRGHEPSPASDVPASPEP